MCCKFVDFEKILNIITAFYIHLFTYNCKYEYKDSGGRGGDHTSNENIGLQKRALSLLLYSILTTILP